MSASDVLFTGQRFSVERVWQTTPGGARPREVVRHPGSVAILPIFDDGRVCLIRNYRVSVQRTLVEVPAGTLEREEDPAACAARELIEETGYRAAAWQLLHRFYLAPGILDEQMHLFLATGLVAGNSALEEGEEIATLIVPWAEALALIARGEICDAKTILALLHYDRWRGRPTSEVAAS